MLSEILALALLAAPKIAPGLRAPPSPTPPAPLIGIAPALTATALRDELRARSVQRQEELAAIARQRAELEKLTAEVAAARTALDASQQAHAKEKVEKQREDKRDTPRGDSRTASLGTSPEALAKTVKGMKTDQAAALITRLERGLAVDVLRRMRPADAGAILDKMKGETAAELFSAMASARASSPHPGER